MSFFVARWIDTARVLYCNWLMPLRAYLDSESAFTSEQLRAMTAALEDATRALDLKGRPDLSLSVIGTTIIRLAKEGEFDPVVLCERTVTALTNSVGKTA